MSERIIMICAGDEGGLGVVHVVGADAVRRPTTCWTVGGDGEQSQVICRAERRFGEGHDDCAATGSGWGLAGGPYHVGMEMEPGSLLQKIVRDTWKHGCTEIFIISL